MSNLNGLVPISEFSRIVRDGGLPSPAANRKAYLDGLKDWREVFVNLASGVRHLRDANESATFARSLEYWLAETIDQPYPTLMADTLISMKRGIPPGASTVVSYGYDHTGEAKVLAGFGEDIPRVDIYARRMTSPMIGLAAAFAVTLQQIREAAQSSESVPLEDLGLSAVRRVLAERVDSILSLGDADTATQGILNVTGVVPGAFVTGGWSAVGGATAAQIDADVSAAKAALMLATGNIFEPDTLLLPTIAYHYIATLPMFALGPMTVLQWLETTHKLRVIKWWRCDGAGVGAVDRAMLFTNRREIIEGYRSIDIELLAPEYRSTYWLTVGHARTGGCNSAHTAAIMYYDNV